MLKFSIKNLKTPTRYFFINSSIVGKSLWTCLNAALYWTSNLEHVAVYLCQQRIFINATFLQTTNDKKSLIQRYILTCHDIRHIATFKEKTCEVLFVFTSLTALQNLFVNSLIPHTTTDNSHYRRCLTHSQYIPQLILHATANTTGNSW